MNIDTPVEEKEQQTPQPKNKESKPRRKLPQGAKYAINIGLVLTITAVVIAMSLWGNVQPIMTALGGAFTTPESIGWMVGAIVLLIVSFGIDALVIFAFSRLYTRHYSYPQSLATQSYRLFYDGIDPLQSAGKVMQVNVLKKQNMPLASAASIMVMSFIVYSFSLLFFESIAMAALAINDKNFFTQSLELFGDSYLPIPMWAPAILGFFIDLCFIVLPLLFAYSKLFKRIVLQIFIPLGAKLKLIKDPGKTTEKANVLIETFKMELKRSFSNIPFAILIFLLFGLSLVVKGMIPFFVASALGAVAEGINILDYVFLATFHQMVASAIPTPGNSGSSEFFFTALFWNAVTDPVTNIPAALIIWRSITYTFPLLITGFITAFYKSPSSVSVKDENIYQTVSSIQIATYEERKRSSDVIFESTELSRQAIHERIFGKKINTDPLHGLNIKDEGEVIVYFNSSKENPRKKAKVSEPKKIKKKPKKENWSDIDTFSKDDH